MIKLLTRVRYRVTPRRLAACAQCSPTSTLRPFSGSSAGWPYSEKRWYSVGTRNAVPAAAVARQPGANAKP